MKEIDTYLSRLSRKVGPLLGRIRGAALLIEPIRIFYAKRYADRHDRWTIISDFDSDLKLRLDRSSYIASCIYWLGYHELEGLLLLNKIIQPQMVLADIGANQGEFTIFAAKRLHSGTVVAFEPVPSLYDTLQMNISLNRLTNVLAFNCGLSDRNAEVSMYTSVDRMVHRSFNEGLASVFQSDYRSTEIGTATLRPFDSFFSELQLNRLDIMKIDTEGSELPVLRGAIETIRHYRPIILMEINEESFTAAGYSTHDLVHFFMGLNYALYLVGRNGQLLPIEQSIPTLCNIVCRPE